MADNYSKMYFKDIYTWLDYESNLWAWMQKPMPKPDDPRIAQMVERYGNSDGEIGITGHVIWLAGVRR